MTQLFEGKRYCTYCRCNKPLEGFVPVHDRRTGRLLNHKCEDCIARARMPETARDARGAQIRNDRRAYQARKLAENIRRRNERFKNEE